MPPPPPTIPAPAKKGIPAIAWVGIGCGGLIIIAIIAGGFIFSKLKGKFDEFAKNPEKAAAELVVATNPELEMVSQDDESGKMTIRTKDGEEMTLSYKDVAEGRITMTDAEGNVTRIGSADLSQVPAWVPKPDGLTDAVSLFHSEAGAKTTGQFSGKTQQDAETLKSFYQKAASDLGMSSSSNTSMSANGTSVNSLSFSDKGRSLTVIVTEKPGEPTQVNTNYSGK